MLLHLISINFVVCTAEISEFHAFFLCFSRLLEKISLVSFGACDNFSLPLVVVSLSMSQSTGSCGHLKGSYDNHSSCLNCSGCFRSSCCSVCQLWPDSTWSLVAKRRRFCDRWKMGKTKEKEERRKRRKGRIPPLGILPVQDRGLEQTVARVDPSGSRSSQGTTGLSPKGGRAHRSTPARSHSGDLAGKYGVQAPAKDFEATFLGPNPTPGDSDQVMLSKDRSPRSESKCPVERSSSCDTGSNARLAMKGSVNSLRSTDRKSLNMDRSFLDRVLA